MSTLPPDMKNFRANKTYSLGILTLSVINLVALLALIAHMDEQLH